MFSGAFLAATLLPGGSENPQDIQRRQYRYALAWIEKYGMWALLLSWLPIIGDLLCLLAGWLKIPILPASLFMFMGKLLRYSVIVLLMTYTFEY